MDILGVVTIPTWMVLIMTIVLLLLLYSFLHLRKLRRLGLPGPRPVPFLGNLLPIMKKGLNPAMMDLVREHGEIFGMYFGHLPTVWISDLELLKRIFIQDFSSFVNRENFFDAGEPFNKDLFRTEDEHWKYMRSVLSPTFSGGKLKQMIPIIQNNADILVGHLEDFSKGGKSVEMKRLFGGYTMDVICSTAFGLQVDSQNTPNDPFVKYARKLFDISSFSNPALALPLMFPFLQPLVPMFPSLVIPRDITDFFAKVTKDALTERKKEGSDRKDFLQLMLNASKQSTTKDEIDDDDGVENENGDIVHDFTHYKHQGLSDIEIEANANLFIIAGYETTSTSLMFASYFLAVNPDCQQKLFEEIDTIIGSRNPTYDDLKKLTYMEMVFSEALRIYPPVTLGSRAASADVTLGGYRIPKGMGIIIPIMALHKDPKLWPEPDKFDPERFSAENIRKRHPMAYLAFAAGPRNCIGMRLAKTEAKMALVCIMQKFRLVPGPDTEIPPKMDVSKNVWHPINGIWLRVEPR